MSVPGYLQRHLGFAVAAQRDQGIGPDQQSQRIRRALEQQRLGEAQGLPPLARRGQ